MDSQAGMFKNIESAEGNYYFEDINYKNSFIVRIDNKVINEKVLKYNDNQYILEFDEDEDLKFLKENNNN